ncbi:hypothetical protein VSX64_24125, partial [Aurantimonas sp. C2-6-R+9]|nr:hypothetical protein [Aurantimonas sp. C2-6-R+9]
ISAKMPKSSLPLHRGPRNVQPGIAAQRSSTNFGTSPSDGEITLFDGTGVGLQDLAVTAAAVRLAERRARRRRLNFDERKCLLRSVEADGRGNHVRISRKITYDAI